MEGLSKVSEFSLELSSTLDMHGLVVGRYRGSFQWMEGVGLGKIPQITLTALEEST